MKVLRGGKENSRRQVQTHVVLGNGCSQSKGFIQESGRETFSSPSEPKSPFDTLPAFSIVWAQQVGDCLRPAQQICAGFVTKTWKEWSKRGGQGNRISLTFPVGFKVSRKGGFWCLGCWGEAKAPSELFAEGVSCTGIGLENHKGKETQPFWPHLSFDFCDGGHFTFSWSSPSVFPRWCSTV